MRIKDKLLEYCEYCGIKKADFCRTAGVTPSFFTQGKGVGSDSIESILAAFPDLSAEWLLRGTGNMVISAEQKDGNICTMDEVSSITESLLCTLHKVTDTNRTLVDVNARLSEALAAVYKEEGV